MSTTWRACNERSGVGVGGEERGNQSGFIIKALCPGPDVQYTIIQNPSRPGPAPALLKRGAQGPASSRIPGTICYRGDLVLGLQQYAGGFPGHTVYVHHYQYSSAAVEFPLTPCLAGITYCSYGMTFSSPLPIAVARYK